VNLFVSEKYIEGEYFHTGCVTRFEPGAIDRSSKQVSLDVPIWRNAGRPYATYRKYCVTSFDDK